MAVIKKLTVYSIEEVEKLAEQYANKNRKQYCSHSSNIQFPEEIAVIELEHPYSFGEGTCNHSIVTKTDCPHLWSEEDETEI